MSDQKQIENIRQNLKGYPDFPKKGIYFQYVFYDVYIYIYGI